MNTETNEKLTAKEYFDKIKELKNENTDEALDKFYDASLLMLSKYNKTGQTKMVDKVMFVLDTIPKERELVKKGINIFVYKEDIEEYINKVENKDVKLIEMENFPREIPDELVDVIEDTKNIFDKFVILFTDYTGKEGKRVAKERREKDPILFGTFINKSEAYERLYYLGDWVDEYCDLTLEKLLEAQGEDIAKTITTPINKEELQAEYQRLKEKKDETKEISGSFIVNNNLIHTKLVDEFNSQEHNEDRLEKLTTKSSIFSKVKTFFSKK